MRSVHADYVAVGAEIVYTDTFGANAEKLCGRATPEKVIDCLLYTSCSLSFSSYLMWKDVRTRMDKFRESKLIRSLLENRSEYSSADATDRQLSSDEAYLEDGKIYLPISACLLYTSMQKNNRRFARGAFGSGDTGH